MRKFILYLVMPVILLATSPSLQAQQQGKIFRLGYLDPSTSAGSAALLAAFRQELGKLGWVEGKDILIEYRFGENLGPELLHKLAAELVRLKVDVIVGSSSTAALAVKSTTATIPTVIARLPDPVGLGLVASLGRPGGNITGFSALGNELNTKRLEILKDAVPRLTRVAVLEWAARDDAQAGLSRKELRPAALALKIKLEEIETQSDAKALESAFKKAKQKQVDAITMVGSPLFFAERRALVELAGKYRFPAIYFQKEFVEEGGLMSYGADFTELFRKSAHYVDKILKGAAPADLPVQQASKFEFVVNLKAAKQIGLTLSPEFLSRANRVIKNELEWRVKN